MLKNFRSGFVFVAVLTIAEAVSSMEKLDKEVSKENDIKITLNYQPPSQTSTKQPIKNVILKLFINPLNNKDPVAELDSQSQKKTILVKPSEANKILFVITYVYPEKTGALGRCGGSNIKTVNNQSLKEGAYTVAPYINDSITPACK